MAGRNDKPGRWPGYIDNGIMAENKNAAFEIKHSEDISFECWKTRNKSQQPHPIAPVEIRFEFEFVFFLGKMIQNIAEAWK